MLKICYSLIVKPLLIIFRSCLQTGTFPKNWKKPNVVPICKKIDKQLLQKYLPVSLLEVSRKFFQRMSLKAIHEFLEENNLLCLQQSEFCSSDSCQNQLLSIVYDISASFDESPTLEVKTIFLDTFKAFDKAWAYWNITKSPPSLLESFLNNRFQKVVLNGQCSNW